MGRSVLVWIIAASQPASMATEAFLPLPALFVFHTGLGVFLTQFTKKVFYVFSNKADFINIKYAFCHISWWHPQNPPGRSCPKTSCLNCATHARWCMSFTPCKIRWPVSFILLVFLSPLSKVFHPSGLLSGVVPEPARQVAEDWEVLGQGVHHGGVRPLRRHGEALPPRPGHHPQGLQERRQCRALAPRWVSRSIERKLSHSNCFETSMKNQLVILFLRRP